MHIEAQSVYNIPHQTAATQHIKRIPQSMITPRHNIIYIVTVIIQGLSRVILNYESMSVVNVTRYIPQISDPVVKRSTFPNVPYLLNRINFPLIGIERK